MGDKLRGWLLLAGVVLLFALGLWISRGLADTWSGEAVAPMRMTGYGGQFVSVTHSGSVSVTCFTNAGVAESCGGSGGSGDAVNVFHQSTIRHISGSVHLAGTIEGARFHVQGLGLPGTSHGGVLTIQGITGMNPIAVDQNTKPWTISHISAQVHVAGTVRMAQHISGGFTFGAVANCGTTARTVIATNANRRSIILQNAGDNLLYIGGTHVTITAANGFPLHASAATQNPQNWHAVLSRVELPFYRGPIACLAAAGNSGLRYIEILDPGGAPKSGF